MTCTPSCELSCGLSEGTRIGLDAGSQQNRAGKAKTDFEMDAKFNHANESGM